MCEKMEINEVEKLIPNLHDEKHYVVHIRVLNLALKHRLILEKLHQVIEFNPILPGLFWSISALGFGTIPVISLSDLQST